MLTKRFFISWIVPSIVMFAASYLWHGIYLNDYVRLSYPKGIFLVAASVAYLVIGFALNKAEEIKYLKRFEKQPFLKMGIVGVASGFFIFLITLVAGVSFSNVLTLENLLLDLSWQMFEQAIGGISIAVVHFFVYEERPLFQNINQ